MLGQLASIVIHIKKSFYKCKQGISNAKAKESDYPIATTGVAIMKKNNVLVGLGRPSAQMQERRLENTIIKPLKLCKIHPTIVNAKFKSLLH